METVRAIIKRRDQVDDDVVDGMMEAFGEAVADGEDPEEALAMEFGLEPDYIMDAEIWRKIEANM